jgi:hypothetical protein
VPDHRAVQRLCKRDLHDGMIIVLEEPNYKVSTGGRYAWKLRRLSIQTACSSYTGVNYWHKPKATYRSTKLHVALNIVVHVNNIHHATHFAGVSSAQAFLAKIKVCLHWARFRSIMRHAT